jgi:hypothetical protein
MLDSDANLKDEILVVSTTVFSPIGIEYLTVTGPQLGRP